MISTTRLAARRAAAAEGDVQCMWCKGEFEAIEGPVHDYMESTPGCWAAFSKVLAPEYENYRTLGNVHRLSADTYAVQHPGRPGRQSTRSVWTHLVASHLYLVRGLDGERTRLLMNRFLQSGQEMAWLDPPDFVGTLNVSYVLEAVDSQDHVRRAREWADSVYSAWRGRHGTEIEAMVQSVLDHLS